MLINQQKMIMSKYLELYDIVIPKNNILRQIKEMVDFNFVYDELKDKYCEDNGRPAYDPIMMFKYLLIKCIKQLSDVDLIEQTRYDLSFKYFLDLAPEETNLIDPTLLTKFRRQRLKDVKLLDMLIGKTVEIAKEKGIIKKKTAIIVDSTHTNSRYNILSARQALINESKKLRKSIYEIDETMKEKMPQKREASGILEEIKYCEELIEIVNKEEVIKEYPKVKEKLNLLKEMVEDNNYNLGMSRDKEARVGHKTADSSFFGYKTHIAMTDERIITAATITSGEKHDGKQLAELLKKSEECGLEVEEILGDAAYSEKENIKLANKRNIRLVAKLNRRVMQGSREKEDKFEYNKDAEMYVCPEGHMAIRKARSGRKNGSHNPRENYYFDIEKCKICPRKEGCYREGSKSKTYSVTLQSNEHIKQDEFQNSEYFKKRYKERYKIEAKHSEIKRNFGYNECQTEGLCGMQIQAALTLFTVNLKRIIKLSTDNG